ncbi:hypothetical protein ABPG74_016891 [Tetrahymena malaccensis]
MYKPQYKSILTSKGSNLVSSGLTSGNQQKGSQSQTNIKITSQQYSNNSIGQLKTNDQSTTSIIPTFESQITSSSRQLSHADTISLFKKQSENNQSKSINQKTTNSNSKLGQTSSPTGLQNGSSNSKLGNQNQTSQSTTSITPFNKYSQNYLSKVKNISLGQQQNHSQQFSSTSQLKVSQNGFFKQQAQNNQQGSLPKQESTQLQTNQLNSTNANTSQQSQNQTQQTLQNQQNSKNIQTRHAKLDLFDVQKEQNPQQQNIPDFEETQDDQAQNKQQQLKKDVSEKEYEKASSALQALKQKMKRGESQNGDYESQQIQKGQDKSEIYEKNIEQQIQRGSELICESKWFQAENEQFDERPQQQNRVPLQDNKNYDQYERRGSNNNLLERNENNRKRQDHSNNRRQNSNINNYEDENYHYDQNYKGNKGRQSLGDEQNRNYINRPKTAMENPLNQNYCYDGQYHNDFRQQNDQYGGAIPSKTFFNQEKIPRNKTYYEEERDLQKSEINNIGRDQQWKGREMGNIMSYNQFRQQNQHNNENQFYYKQQQNYSDNNPYRENYRQQPYIDYDDRANYYGNMQNNNDFYEKNYRANDYNDDRNRNYPRYEQYDNYPPQRMYDYDDNYNKYRGPHHNYHNERDYYNYDQNMERSQTFYPPQNRYYNGPHYPPPPHHQQYGNNGYERDYQKQRRVSEFNQDYADNHNYNHNRRQTEFEGYRGEMQYDPSRYQVRDGIQKSQVIYEQNYMRDTSNPRQIHRETRQDQNFNSDNYLRGQRSRSPINHNISQPDNQRYQNQMKYTRQQDQSPFNRHNETKNLPNQHFNGPIQDEQEIFNNKKNLDQDRQKSQQINNYVRPEYPQNNKRYSDQPDYFKTVNAEERNQRNLDDQHNIRAEQKYEDPYLKKSHLNFQENQKQENRQKPNNQISEKEFKNQENLKSPLSKQKMIFTDDQQKQQQVNLRVFDEQKGLNTPNQNNQNNNIYKSTNSNINRNLDFDEKSQQQKSQQQQYQQQKENVKNFNDNYPKNNKNNNYSNDEIPAGPKSSKNYHDETPVGPNKNKNNINETLVGPKNNQYNNNEFPLVDNKKVSNFNEQPNKDNKKQVNQNEKGDNKQNISQQQQQYGKQQNNKKLQNGQKYNTYEDDGNESNIDEGPIYLNSKQLQSKDVKTLQGNYESNDDRPIKPSASQGYDLKNIPQNVMYGQSVPSNTNKANSNQYNVKAPNSEFNDDRPIKQSANQAYDLKNIPQNLMYGQPAHTNSNKTGNNQNNIKAINNNYEYNDDRPIKQNANQTYDLKNIPQNVMYGQSPPSNTNKLGNQNQRKTNQQNLKQQQMMSEQSQQDQLFECSQGCGRKFNQESLHKHEKICKKVFQQKRKQFDSQAARLNIQGIDQLDQPPQIVNKQQKKNTNQNQNKKEKIDKNNNSNKPSWKMQSEAFRMQLQQQRTGQASDPESSAMMQQALGYVPCNFCGRKFNKVAAERHIPFCEKKAKENQVKGVSNKQAPSNINQNGKQPMKQSQTRLQTNQNNKRY